MEVGMSDTQLFNGPKDPHGYGIEVPPVTVVGPAVIGFVEEVHGEKGRPVPEYIPTRHELEVLVEHWVLQVVDLERWWAESDTVGSDEIRLHWYALDRLDKLAALLGEGAIDDAFARHPEPADTNKETTLGMADLILRWNNSATNDPCALCGARTDPEVGWEVMTSGLSLVCHDCVRELAPGLLAAREVAWQALEGFPWEEANGPEWADDVILGWNESTACGPCALCGAPTSPRVGWESMTRGRSPVCAPCARDLGAARDAANLSS
jgi:hypothetical protein